MPTLLRAFARLVSKRKARLIVLGEGRFRSSLLSLANGLGVAECVDFPGFTENPFAFLARADLFVLSSRNEGLPTVLIEAMVCGCPVVSTDCDFGPREILEDGRHGPLVPVGEPEALAGAMLSVLNNPPRREALQARAEFFNATSGSRPVRRAAVGWGTLGRTASVNLARWDGLLIRHWVDPFERSEFSSQVKRMVRISDIHVVAPHFKRRYSGVTSTIIQLVPKQAVNSRNCHARAGLAQQSSQDRLVADALAP